MEKLPVTHIIGNVYLSVGEYEKAREHLERSLAIQKEIGDRNGEADLLRKHWKCVSISWRIREG